MEAYKALVNQKHIAYTETDPGAAKTIFFIHGNSNSSGIWNKQLSDKRFAAYRLIAIDLPGHGDSDIPLNPDRDYSVTELGSTVAEVVKKLSPDNPFILAGLSLGSNIVAESTKHLLPTGIVLAGSSVLGEKHTMQEAFKEGLDGSVFFSDDATQESISRFVNDAIFFRNKDDQNLILSEYSKVRPGFRPRLMKTVQQGMINDEIALLKDTKIPVLVIFGKEEKLANPDYLDDAPFKLWNDQIYKLPEAGHFVQLDQPDEFNELLLAYANERFAI